MWKDTLNVAGQYATDTFVLHSILSVLGIYIICTLIDQARIAWIEKPLFGWMDRNRLFDKCKHSICNLVI